MMKPIAISDVTLREDGKAYALSFKEKIEIAKILDRTNVDVIEVMPFTGGRTDVLFLHTICPLVKNAALAVPVPFDNDGIAAAFDAVKTAKKVRLSVCVPASTVQMEYMLHKKPAAVSEMLASAVKACKALCDDVEVSFADATRADAAFLYDAVKAAAENGATVITVCDSAGEMLPLEFEAFLKALCENAPLPEGVTLSVECSDALHMAAALAVGCIAVGVTQIKVSAAGGSFASLASVSHIFRAKSDALGVCTGVNMTVIDNAAAKVRSMIVPYADARTPYDAGTGKALAEALVLTENDDMSAVERAAESLGYELNEEDLTRVYEEFLKVAAKKKTLGEKELDAIVASVAMQVPPTYKLRSYVINDSNLIVPSAHIELEKNGKVEQGIFIGDGPIDAAFLAIEQITGRHYELDDFQIQTVTEGREAMGSSVVRLRSGGKVYAGKGISTDIIGASIKAYINALNKICYEEAVK